MKIRNLQEFVKDRCQRKDIDSLKLLFTEDRNEEPFLSAILGDEGDVDNMVEKLASFAKDPEQQVFYEFTQNAFDANADTVYFYAGTIGEKDYLLVVNDGKPFYTDPKVKNKEDKREGQLFSFLNKGKSDKPSGPNLGEFGMGSKLLYTLLTDHNDEFSVASLMTPAIIEGRRAPFLLSWADGTQLDNFLLDRNMWDRSCGYANTEFLIAKILCCYYPLEPGVDQELFSNEEVSELVNVIKQLVNPEHLLHRFRHSGTAIIIPLGKGKLQKLTEEHLIKKIGDCLAPFSFIIGGYKEFKNKHLSRIVFMGREIKEIHADRVSVDIKKSMGDKTQTYCYQFVFDESLSPSSTVNLYKALPISDAVYNLKFVIDSLDFPVDDSRQDISESNVAINGITKAMTALVEKLNEIKVSDREKFDRIYRCLLSSRPNNNIVKKPFDEVIIPFLKNNIRLANGDYGTIDTSVCLPCKIAIPINDLGINGLFGVDGDVKDNYDQLGIGIKDLSLSTIVEKSDKIKLSKWVESLSEKEYAEYHTEILSIVKYFPTTNLLRTNKGNVISYNDAIGTEINVYFCDVAKDVFYDCEQLEYVELPLGRTKPQSPERIIWEKIKKHETEFQSKDLLNEVCAVLYAIDGIISTNEIRWDVKLLTNLRGEKLPFGDLFKKRPNDTILFEKYVVKYPLPTKVKDNWFVSNSQIWNWLRRNWEGIKGLDDWETYHTQYLKDIQYAWKSNNDYDKKTLELCLDEKGIPLNESYYYIEGTKGTISEAEYNELESVFNAYEIVPYRFRKLLTEAPFALSKVRFRDIFDETTSSITITPQQLSVIVKYVNGFWQDYHVEIESEDSWIITPLSGYQCNYWCSVELASEEIKNLEEAGFFRVSNQIHSPSDEYHIDKNSMLLKKAIERVKSRILLFPIVKKNTAVLDKYCDYLEYLPFSSSEKIEKGDMRWQIISWFASQEEYRNDIWGKILLDGQFLPSDKLCPNLVKVKDSKEYKAYELLPRLATEDAIVNKLLSIVPEKVLFENSYCKERRSSISVEEVLEELDHSEMSVYQLEFSLDCANHGYDVRTNLQLSPDEDLNDALEMMFKRKFKNFYKKFNIPEFDPYSQIYASPELLLDSERIPAVVFSWLSRHEKENVFDLFEEHALNKNHFLIQARKALLQSQMTSIPSDIEEDDMWILDNTFEWIIEQQEDGLTITHSSPAMEIVQSLQALIQPSGSEMPYLLRYESSLSVEDKMQYSLEMPTSRNVSFLSIGNNDQRDKLCSFLKDRQPKLIDFFDDNDIYLPLEPKALMRKHMLANNTMLSVRYESTKDNSWIEWNDNTYKKWLTRPESDSIRIFVSPKPIGSKLSLLDGTDCLLDLPLQEGSLYGYSVDEKGNLKEVVVTSDNNNSSAIFKALECNAVPNIPGFQQPFIALQGLKLEELMHEEIRPEILDVIRDMTPDQIERLGAGEGGTGTGPGTSGNEREDESKVNMISGYLGELLYNQYLERKGHSVEWSAQEGEGKYDFCINGDTYVEVKTNVRTLKDGNAPFYLHKSQMEFLHDHDTEKYYVCRLSLTDIGIYNEYVQIRDQFGMDADPMFNDKLKNECGRIVDEYWRENDLEEFEDVRWLYNIRDMFNILADNQ